MARIRLGPRIRPMLAAALLTAPGAGRAQDGSEMQPLPRVTSEIDERMWDGAPNRGDFASRAAAR